MTSRRERGFSLIEVLIASALTIGVLLAATTAVANSLHGSALAAQTMALHDDALNVLTDVRALTAYDDMSDLSRTRLRALVGRSATTKVMRPNRSAETITLTVSQAPGAPNPVANATVNAHGISVTERTTLSVEAPSPGSSVRQ